MFPPQVPAVFIRWLTRPGDVVYDPFSGRGTVALEAARTGRIAYAADANPLAVALSQAKVRIPAQSAVSEAVDRLERRYRRPSVRAVPPDIQMLYSRKTLEQIVFLREVLADETGVASLLKAATLGLLHGNHSKQGATRGFSVSMPNTFAMSPGYVRGYIARNGLVAPDVDVFALLRRRLERLALPNREVGVGEVWEGDASQPPAGRDIGADLVFTSPPYLEVIKYAKYNWVRLWYLGKDPREIDAGLMATGSLPRYLDFMRRVLEHLSAAAKRDSVVCLVIGDVRRGVEQVNLAAEVWREVAAPADWRFHALIADEIPSRHKVSRIWKGNEGRATKTDRVLVVSPPGGDKELPAVPRIDWRSPDWLAA